MKDERDLAESEITRLKNKLLCGMKVENFEAWKSSTSEALSYYLETMYAAYLTETSLSPENVVLRTGIIDGKDREIYYFFEPRDSKNIRVIETH